MKVYLDVIFFLNFSFDFLLLLSVSLLLRRNVKLRRIFLGAFLGALSIFFLFFKMNSFLLFLFKVGISILMILSTFGYHNFTYTRKNFSFLYSTSMLFGGVLYCLNSMFSYKQEGLIFYHHGIGINFYVLLILSPLLLRKYVKEMLHLKTNYKDFYKVRLYEKKKIYEFQAFLDTGNRLKDPYTGKPILLISKKHFKGTMKNPIIVPYETISGKSLLLCKRFSKLEIEGVGERKNFLVGFLDEEIGMDGVDCILQERILEGDYV